MTDKSSRSPSQTHVQEKFSATSPEKRHKGNAKVQKSGAASMDKWCSQPKPNVRSEAVKLIAPKRKRADDAVAVKTAESAGSVLTAE